MIYQAFAEFYDDLFDASLYEKWRLYTIDRSDRAKRLLDLACGTGRLAVKLAQSGYQVDGADLSADMLSMADQYAQENKIHLNLFESDMRDLGGLPMYGTVTCFDDSLCYLQNETDLKQTFQQVYNHLDSQGKFLFDVITPHQTDDVYPGYMYNFQDDDRAFIWSSYAGEAVSHSVEHELTFFLYNPQKDAYDAYNELHKERTYPVSHYLKDLREVGFDQVQVSTNFGKDGFNEEVKRWFFDCRKG